MGHRGGEGSGAIFARAVDELAAQDRVLPLVGGSTKSARLLTAADGLGFSCSDVRVAEATDSGKAMAARDTLVVVANRSMP